MRVDVAFTPAEKVSAHVGIVVDVIRATSSIAQALASGYERVLCCAEIDEARALREELGDEAVVGGERNAIVVDGFDVGASPREFAGPPKARTLILTTTNGTRAILTAASECDVVLLGSIASAKYVDVLTEVFGNRLLFPSEFVGRGDMSRGGLLLRCVRAGEELTYVPVAGAVRHGARPPRLPPIRGILKYAR